MAALFVGPLVAAAGLDEDRVCSVPQQQAVGLEGDAVVFVGRDQPRPDRFRDHAEHAAAVETEFAGAEKLPVPHDVQFTTKDRVAGWHG